MNSWQDTPMGKGWMWDDYTDEYSAERSAFPIYGNNISLTGTANSYYVIPSYFTSSVRWTNKPFYSADTYKTQRGFNDNIFYAPQKEVKNAVLPFLTYEGRTNANLLEDTTNRTVIFTTEKFPVPLTSGEATTIYSIKAKELYQPMMERSDNFFAEQTLLMSAMKSTGAMNIDSFLKKFTKEKLSDIPQQPQWVDGSGLSRYNLCTPQSIVYVLNKIQQEFGMATVKEIFMTGGEGTIKSYYTSIAGSIFAKTGTLSDNSAFSGYLITKNKNLLAFSLMANNYQKGGRSIRLAFQDFLMKVWETQ
jgi:D-alanyl-D-alanine carboxypeptidase/D-alanyl-D-alanine-endopeptidase (penicillin-binding protein 4)